MFNGAKAFDQDISTWTLPTAAIVLDAYLDSPIQHDTAKHAGITPAYEMADSTELATARDSWFSDNDAAKVKYGGIGDWDTTRVTSFKELFEDKTDFNDDISKWNTAKVTTM